MEVITADALISINATIIVQLLSFLIFAYIINRIMFRPLNETISERDGYMDDLKQSVIEAEEESDRLTEQLAERESEAKNEALKLKAELQVVGNQEVNGIYSRVQQEIESLKQSAEVELNNQIADARKSAVAESEQLAVSIMEKILNRRLAV